MIVAVVGSRGLRVDDLGKYLPDRVTEIVSGNAKGIDIRAREYANSHNIRLTEFLPKYRKYGKVASLKRNITIIEHTDMDLAFGMDLLMELSLLWTTARTIIFQ